MENLLKNLTKTTSHITRGFGLLEPVLARMRAQIANNLIPDHLRNGRILDIGCGSYPYFLAHTYFSEKFAIDQLSKPEAIPNINWYTLNVNANPHLSFEDNYFAAISMLAVVEHLNPSSLVLLLQEIRRTLRPGGMLIITTPAAWSEGLLRAMSRFHLVSQEEIKEHVYVYTLPLLGWYFGRAGFEMDKIKFGYFEFNLNLWATAIR